MLEVTPIGGVNEIGSNCTLVETQNQLIFLDYGILFPYEDVFKINYLIANLDFIDSKSKEVSLIITHAHEDHIGAIKHFVEHFKFVSVYCSKFSREIMKKKLQDIDKDININYIIYTETSSFRFDQITIKPVHVTHSIPQTCGMIIEDRSRDMSLLFISDFKYDLNPIYEKPFDTNKILTSFSKFKFNYCMLDSTNILNPGKTISESELTPSFEMFLNNKSRLFITLFASNIYRVINILENAKKYKRRIVIEGRSIWSYLDAADKSGVINLDDYKVHKADQVENLEDPKNLVLLTGCQGEHFGALNRIAQRTNKYFKFKDGDIILFSSKAIPGNEKKVARLMNSLVSQGAEVVTAKDSQVHASGHPGQEDLKLLIDIISPTHYIPIHGETYFLKKHIDFIKENTQASPIYLTNYKKLVFPESGVPKIQELDHLEPKIITGKGVEIQREQISERRKIAEAGVVMITLSLKKNKTIITAKGVNPEILSDLESTIESLQLKTKNDVSEDIRVAARRFLNGKLGYRPIVVVHVV